MVESIERRVKEVFGDEHLINVKSRKIGISQNHFGTSKIESLNIVATLRFSSIAMSSAV
jgi:hypothetical protein